MERVMVKYTIIHSVRHSIITGPHGNISSLYNFFSFQQTYLINSTVSEEM